MATSDKPLRIIFLEQYGSLGGGQQILLELVASARSLGCAVDVLIPGGKAADTLVRDNVAVCLIEECALQHGRKSVYDFLKWVAYSVTFFVKHIALFKKADFIYVNGARLLLVGALVSFFLRKKAAYHLHLHHSVAEYRLFRSLLYFSLTQGLIVPSTFIRRQLPQSESRIFTVANGLDARFSDMVYQDRFTNEPLRQVVIVGRISPEKGQDILLMLAPAYKDMTFHVLGDASFADDAYYRNLRKASPANVFFHGWVDDVGGKIDELQAQLWLVPSRCAESSSLVCMQGAAVSCLVAVRGEGALVDMAGELDFPIFHKDEDMLHLLDQLRKCDSGQFACTTSRAFHKVMAHYSHDVLQTRFTNMLRNMLF